jgi:hypothetical protein
MRPTERQALRGVRPGGVPAAEWERLVNEALRRVAGAPPERREAAINGARLMLTRAIAEALRRG